VNFTTISNFGRQKGNEVIKKKFINMAKIQESEWQW